MSTLRKRATAVAPDHLSDWTIPPPSARDLQPVRVFDTAAAALAFIKTLRASSSGVQQARPKAA